MVLYEQGTNTARITGLIPTDSIRERKACTPGTAAQLGWNHKTEVADVTCIFSSCVRLYFKMLHYNNLPNLYTENPLTTILKNTTL